MKKIRHTKSGRIKINANRLPTEIVGRLESLTEHQSLREQRETFTDLLKHPAGTYRWNAHLVAIPFYHIIETESYGEKITFHIYHPRSRSVMTLQMQNRRWKRGSITPEDAIEMALPSRCMRTGWLTKQATKGQLSAVAGIIGRREQPHITAANANVIIHTHALMPHLSISINCSANGSTKSNLLKKSLNPQ